MSCLFRVREYPRDGYDEDMENYIETQSKILTSATLAMQTVKSLNLDQRSEIRRPAGQSVEPCQVAAPSDGPQSPPPGLGAFLGGHERQARAEHPAAGCDFHDDGSRSSRPRL